MGCKHSSRRLWQLLATYTLSVYYIIVIDIYLKIISISYKIHISEYIVYNDNNSRVFMGK